MNPLGNQRPRSRPRPAATSDVPAVDVYALGLRPGAGRAVLRIAGRAMPVSIEWEQYLDGVRVRPWFRCACGSRRRFLHVQEGRASCRQCLGLVYRSRCQSWASARALRRAVKLRRKLGADEVPFGDLPPRPWHHWPAKRYDRLVREIAACEREALGAIAPVYAALSKGSKS
jgi:hypothetical protein